MEAKKKTLVTKDKICKPKTISFFQWLGCFCIATGIALPLISYFKYEEINLMYTVICVAGGLVTGMLHIALATIIDLLYELVNKDYVIEE